MNYSFDTPIRDLAGIGKKRAECFGNIGITTVRDLLYHFPRAYQQRGKILDLAMTPDGTVGAFMLTVATPPKTVMLKNRMKLTKMAVFDNTGKANVVFFNQSFVKDIFHVGEEYRFWGKISVTRNGRELLSPVYERVIDGIKLPDLVPIYPLTEGLTQKIIKYSVCDVLDNLKKQSLENIEFLPKSLTEKENIPDMLSAFEAIHRPIDSNSTVKARERFVFEELYLFALSVLLIKKVSVNKKSYRLALDDFSEFEQALPYRFTNAQRRSVNEIYADLSNEKQIPMNRLLSGDVGSGKTVCAAFAAYCALKNNRQCVLMAPTEILAAQHYSEISALFAKFNFTVALLTGSTGAETRRKILKGLKDGSIGLVIGTHAVLTEDVEFANLSLVITDEQHRFGVRQRGLLAKKGVDDNAAPHILVMSATPIPRTLAMILYGDLSVSVLDEMPPGRQKVDTFLVDEAYRTRLNGFIEKNAKDGQVYIVCPAIEKNSDEEGLVDFEELGNENTDGNTLKYASEYAELLKNDIFPNIKVGLLHGKMKASEKKSVMEEFSKGEIRILVSTTVIEVGVNVPNATLIVIENADRFGLSQLHQLRGRVGRGNKKSYCVLVSSVQGEKSLERLKVMCKTSDGYKIAEADLAQRGPGDFFPNNKGDARQHGGLKFRYASLCDMEMLKKAFEYAGDTLKNDSRLLKEENSLLRSTVVDNYRRLTGT